jgi:TonB-dependent receptor
MAGHAALAQDNATAPQQAGAQSTNVNVKNAGADNQIATVVVSTRRSQQSSIERKKNAATALDSIVAEDVGSLPDRNIGEAISRMAGIALDRGDFGEGVTVAVRGNGPDLTRVEVDGMAAQSANNAAGGRGSEFRQLSADLIKSVDVVKGSTADMTEGSLGGGIIIKTRTGLDFKEPFVSVRVSGTTNNLSKKWEPDTNVILSRKFMDNRLGLILNASKSTTNNEQHQMQVATSAAAGYARSIDFDNSPEKTFTFNPATLNMADPASTTPATPAIGGVGILPYTTGTGNYITNTPQEILTKSAAATTKAQCYSAFPQITLTDASVKNLSSTNRTTAVNERQNELITCLNQWNDYTPSLIRNKVQTELDHRQNLDLRGDFKVNRELTVYLKGSYSKRATENNTSFLSLGGVSINASKTFTDTNGVRAVASGANGAGYYLYPSSVSYLSGGPAIQGAVANIDPSTVTVDASHHVTSFGVTGGAASVDQIYQKSDTVSRYFQSGGEWRHGSMLAEWLVGDAKSNYNFNSYRTTFSTNYGSSQLSVEPNGLWSYNFPAGSNFNLYNPANYVQLVQPAASAAVTGGGSSINSVPAYTQAQQPMLTYSQPQLTYNPGITDTEERTAKADFTFQMPEAVPFLTRFKTGFNFRDTRYGSYGGGGYQQSVTPNVWVLPDSLRSVLVGCQDTAGSLGTGGNNCKYGYTPSNAYSSASSGTVTVTPAQFQDIVANSINGNITNSKFFNGANGEFGGAVTNWPNIDVQKVFQLAGITNANQNCIYSCTGTDGKTYQQPVTRMSERSEAAYLMTDFNIDHIPFTSRSLPFGWSIDGNLGYRYIRTKVHGVGIMTFQSITKNANFDPLNPNAAAGVDTTQVATNTAVDATTHDFLPIYNLAMWVIPDQLVVRYNRARTVARPPVTDLLPSGTCTYDQRKDDDGLSQSCSKTVGNPALRAQKNLNQNWSAEYYPNKDTMVSLSYFKQKGIVGPALTQTANGTLGLALVDPVTHMSLAELPFSYPTWVNGVPTTRTGWELNTKTAFTFLPWRLRYLGFDGNYTKLGSVTSTQNIVDLLTGTPLPPLRESKFQYNWAFWYDDGRFSARVAVQGVSSYFNNIAGSSSNYLNNYPNASGNTRPPSYNPGSPNFKDATRYIDAKIQYRITPNIDVFVEGRNLGNAATSDSQGAYVPFSSGAPSILDYSYSGRRIMVGADFRFGG